MTRGRLPDQQDFEVTWTVKVKARSFHEAAELARERMIDPGVTQADFLVKREGLPPKTVVVQDPDRA